uniref:Cytochrome c oxidase subunit 5B, mitochondrial n=1 Tax=Aotus nancymaae TaxID=37293 RepID=A0A2K5ETI3_AOTNA
MASRLLDGAGALRAGSPNGTAMVRVTGLEREVMMAARKELDPHNVLLPKAASGTKEDPNLVPSITNKRIVDNSAVIWFGLHKGKTQQCLSCGTHYKLVPHQLAH